MLILGIETSCDETAAAVVQDGQTILSSIVASQINIHAAFGGVVPEVAARSHIGEVLPVIETALTKANVELAQIDAIAVTRGPGLIGSLLIGTLTAKTLGEVLGKPVVGVNHIVAHAMAGFLSDTPPQFPILALTVSGGHTALTLYQQDLGFEIIGETQDDAAGEAFDKVAKLLGLSYPGGPALSKLAETGNATTFKFPIAKMQNPLDFSFSGLKTAVLRKVLELQAAHKLTDQTKADLAASFEHTIVESLVRNTVAAVTKVSPASIVVGGGVAANKYLRSELHRALPNAIFTPLELCGDNAAMIAATAFKMLQNDLVTPPPIQADSSLEIL